MNCNGDSHSQDDSVVCLDTSQESVCDNDIEVIDNNDVDNKSSEGKTLPPGDAPDGFIVIDDIDGNQEEINDHQEHEPIIKVIFRDKAVACEYRKRVKDFLQRLVRVNLPEDNSSDLVLEIWDKDSNKRKHDDNLSSPLFTIDNKPVAEDFYNIPAYGKKFDRVLKESTGDSDEENDCAGPKLTCFNCIGNHNLRDCPKPRNFNEINKNRKEFSSRSTSKNSRYHVEEQKFVPGVLSSELRKALGLSHNELPKHIFKMRLLGYPPGWLEEAKLEHSGLNLYNSDGRRVLDPAEEVGEIFSPEDNAKFDMKKIHDYPGFNVAPAAGTRDAYWNPEMQALHSKERMLQMLSCRKAEQGYKKKKLERSVSEPSPDAIICPVEMDCEPTEDSIVELVPINGEDSQEPAPPGCEPELPMTPKTDPSCDSPSLADLERRKKLLLQELNDSNLSSPGTPLSSQNNSTAETPKSSAKCLNLTATPPVTPVTARSSTSDSENTPKLGSVKTIELGTPLIKSTSKYSRLPDSDKFSKDICDVINFENLPGATGKYEKMSGIIQKIRTLTNQDYS
ncbi:zinc finger CCHC domain-containing protein 8 homolog [Microplitis mediator]|uniref:zinc finger CCHC domain-containing protein 8 homolog n=1 Tax=Microplitis mediator TaxID=375433 RepID=UPI0025530E43|nr:zinc finger CCHC domain-containing protein 8 homolog [Microplitis mediator]